tara:strand:+ start:336 stop:746 length:411 start_codon:yes stop_codon:yes gene_type:complete
MKLCKPLIVSIIVSILFLYVEYKSILNTRKHRQQLRHLRHIKKQNKQKHISKMLLLKFVSIIGLLIINYTLCKQKYEKTAWTLSILTAITFMFYLVGALFSGADLGFLSSQIVGSSIFYIFEYIAEFYEKIKGVFK